MQINIFHLIAGLIVLLFLTSRVESFYGGYPHQHHYPYNGYPAYGRAPYGTYHYGGSTYVRYGGPSSPTGLCPWWDRWCGWRNCRNIWW